MIGAGAGPFDFVGKNSEMMTNLKVGSAGVDNASRVAFIGDKDECILDRLPGDQPRCALMMNLLVSEGKPGEVRQMCFSLFSVEIFSPPCS